MTKTSRKILTACAVLGIAVFAWLDMSEYLMGLREFANGEARASLIAEGTGIRDDLSLQVRCSRLREFDQAKKEFRHTPADRECWLDAMPKVKTPVGAIVFAQDASAWLLNNPGDDQLRQAALRAVSKGREGLLNAKVGHLDRLARMKQAREKSFILRMLAGESKEITFAMQAKDLEIAEFSILQPEASRRNKLWLLKAETN